MYDIYTSNDFDFHYVSLIVDKNSKAEQRSSELGIDESPDVYFDGEYTHLFGEQSNRHPYENAIETCSERVVADVNLTVDVEMEEEAVLKINITITNNHLDEYNGTLRTYIVEPISRWNNYDGDPYHFGLLDLMVNEISVSDVHTVTKTWDGAAKGFGDVSEDIPAALNEVEED